MTTGLVIIGSGQCLRASVARSRRPSHPVLRTSLNATTPSRRRILREQRFQLQSIENSESTTSVAVPEAVTASSSPNGVTADSAAPVQPDLGPDDLVYSPPDGWQRFLTSFRLAFALPWRRFKKGSVLVMTIEGEIGDQLRGRFDRGLSMPQLCSALKKAALDPRIDGICFEVGPLACGWAKLQELRQHLAHFQKSGKFCMAYMTRGGEKEYYLASAADELYVPPSASISLRGFSVAGTFLRGVFDKVGIEPQVRRIGEYKSAGDQLLRRDMSDAQREQLGALLEDIYSHFVTTIAASRNKTVEEVEALLQSGVFDTEELKQGGWVDGLRYEDEIIDDLKKRTDTEEGKDLKKVGLRKYAAVSPSAFGLRGKKAIAIIRASGAIVGGNGGASGTITANDLIGKLRAAGKNKAIEAVVLRIDSPGGDALASDLMWREIQKLAAKKPVIASMADVAASGGYYMAMAANKIIAEPLTITGSIGVVTGKFNLQELYQRLGYAKTVLSKGRYAELLAENRGFTPEEEDLFDRSAQHAYASFRDKAAASRGMDKEVMQKVAQGRVWSGQRALEVGLVDALGGITRAIGVAKAAAKIPAEEKVSLLEVSRAAASPLSLLSLGGASVSAQQLLVMLAGALAGAPGSTGSVWTAADMPASAAAGVGALGKALAGLDVGLLGLSGQPGAMSYLMTDVDAASMGSSSPMMQPLGGGASRQFLDDGDEEDGWMAEFMDALFE